MKKYNFVIIVIVIFKIYISVLVMIVLFGNDILKNYSIIFYI